MARDLTLVERLSHLHPAVVADCLDRQGIREQVLAAFDAFITNASGA